jgi:hypothetical protein
MWLKSKVLMAKTESPDDIIEVDVWINAQYISSIRNFTNFSSEENKKPNSVITLTDGVDYFVSQTPEEIFKLLGYDSEGGLPNSQSNNPTAPPLNTSM